MVAAVKPQTELKIMGFFFELWPQGSVFSLKKKQTNQN